ncbi:MAG: hypothetical protein AAFW84_24905 [Cyanobacteria bacterium J06635_15]
MTSTTPSNDSNTEAYQATQYLLRRKIPPSLYYKLRNFSRQYPILFLPLARWRWSRWRKQYNITISGPEPAAPDPVTRNTAVVIEGFPRMGNTFAHIAFKMAQPEPVKIGHHTHAAAQVVAAAKMDIPTIVLIREPEAAIVSYLIGDFDPSLGIGQSLREYISFYKTILPYREKVIIASFDDVTSDYGSVIQMLNDKFNTNFGKFDHTEENVNRCFELIEEGYQYAFGTVSEKVVCRPSEVRQAMKQDIQTQFYSDTFSSLRQRAETIYKALTQATP